MKSQLRAPKERAWREKTIETIRDLSRSSAACVGSEQECAVHLKHGWCFSFLPPPASQLLRHQLPPQKAADSPGPASFHEPWHKFPLLREKNPTQHRLNCWVFNHWWQLTCRQQSVVGQSLSHWIVDELPWLQAWQRDRHGNVKVKSWLAWERAPTHTHTQAKKKPSTCYSVNVPLYFEVNATLCSGCVKSE